MDNNSFFKWVWRFNAIALALGLLAVGGLIATWTFGPFFVGTPPHTNTNLVDPANVESASQVKFVLSEGRHLEGTNFMKFELRRVTLGARRGSFSSGGYYTASEIANVLIVNESEPQGRWLFEGIERTIEGITPITGKAVKAEGKEDVSPIIGLLIQVKTVLPAMQPQQAPKEEVIVFADRLDGRPPEVVVEGIDWVRTISQPDPDHLLMVYEAAGKTVAERYSSDTLKPLSRAELPRLTEQLMKEQTEADGL